MDGATTFPGAELATFITAASAELTPNST